MNKIKFHEIKHDLKTTLWCGPGALAILSGERTSVIREIVRSVRGNPASVVKGMFAPEMIAAANKLGFHLLPYPTGFRTILRQWTTRLRPTLRQWTKANRSALREKTFLLIVGGHFVLVQGRRFVDNWTKTPVPLSAAPKPRRRVQQAWEVIFTGAKDMSTYAPKPKPADPYRKERAEAKRLAKECGVEIEEGNFPGEYWVWPPEGFDETEDSPYYGDHYACNGWADILKRIRTYAEAMRNRIAPPIVTSEPLVEVNYASVLAQSGIPEAA